MAKFWISIIVLIVVAVGVIGYFLTSGPNGASGADNTSNSSPALGSPQSIALGREIYAANCLACHGDKLQGQPNWQVRKANGRLPAPPHDETGHTWHHPDQVLFALTKYGPAVMAGQGYESDMPAYEGILSDTQIHQVLGYVKSTWPEKIRREQERRSKQMESAQ